MDTISKKKNKKIDKKKKKKMHKKENKKKGREKHKKHDKRKMHKKKDKKKTHKKSKKDPKAVPVPENHIHYFNGAQISLMPAVKAQPREPVYNPEPPPSPPLEPDNPNILKCPSCECWGLISMQCPDCGQDTLECYECKERFWKCACDKKLKLQEEEPVADVDDMNAMKCKCGSKRLVMTRCSECGQDIMACSDCGERLWKCGCDQLGGYPLVRSNCGRHRSESIKCKCGSERVMKALCEECGHETIGCRKCGQRLWLCGCDESDHSEHCEQRHCERNYCEKTDCEQRHCEQRYCDQRHSEPTYCDQEQCDSEIPMPCPPRSERETEGYRELDASLKRMRRLMRFTNNRYTIERSPTMETCTYQVEDSYDLERRRTPRRRQPMTREIDTYTYQRGDSYDFEKTRRPRRRRPMTGYIVPEGRRIPKKLARMDYINRTLSPRDSAPELVGLGLDELMREGKRMRRKRGLL